MSDVSAAEAAKVVAPEAAAAELPDPANAEVEARARRQGWRPKEEFRGDVNRWTDAKTFVERGDAELPILRERYRALDDRFAKQESSNREMTTRVDEMRAVLTEQRDLARQAEQRGYLRAKGEIEARMAQAVDVADKPTYAAAKAQLDELERTKPPPAPAAEAKPETRQQPAQPTIDPVAQQWVRDNPWWENDRDLQDYANARHLRLVRERPDLSMRDNLDQVKHDTMAQFPDKFANTRRAAPAAVAASSAPVNAGGKKGKTVADLPADAKQALARFKKQIPNYKDQDYLDLYFAGDE